MPKLFKERVGVTACAISDDKFNAKYRLGTLPAGNGDSDNSDAGGGAAGNGADRTGSLGEKPKHDSNSDPKTNDSSTAKPSGNTNSGSESSSTDTRVVREKQREGSSLVFAPPAPSHLGVLTEMKTLRHLDQGTTRLQVARRSCRCNKSTSTDQSEHPIEVKRRRADVLPSCGCYSGWVLAR